LYAAALPQNVTLNTTQRAILNDPEIRKLVRTKAAKFSRTRQAPNIYDAKGNVKLNPTMTVNDIHAIQQAMADQARIESRAGAKGGTAVLWRDRKTLMNAANEATLQPDGTSLYKTATEIFAGEVQLAEAANAGFKFMKDRPGVIRRRLSRMSKGEREAYQVGALEAMVDMIDAPRDTQNTALRLLGSVKARKRVKELFDSDEQFDKLLTGVEQEMDLRNTLDQATGGSSTKQTSEDIARLREEMVGVDPDVAGTFDIGTAVAKPTQSIFAIRRLFDKGGAKLFGASRKKRFSQAMDELGDLFFTQGRAENAEIQAMLLARQRRNLITDIMGRITRGVPGAAAVTAPQAFEGPFGGAP